MKNFATECSSITFSATESRMPSSTGITRNYPGDQNKSDQVLHDQECLAFIQETMEQKSNGKSTFKIVLELATQKWKI